MKRRDQRLAKEWANKDMYNPSRGVPEPRVVPLPQCEVVVRTIPTRAAQGVHSCGVPPQRDSGRRVGFGCGEFVG